MKRIEQYTDSLHTLTHFVNEAILDEIRNLPNTETEEPYRFTYTILNKLNAGLNVSALLVKNIDDSTHFADSLAVILRSLISDVIVFYHVIGKSETTKN